MRCQACVIFSEYYLLDLPLWFGSWLWNPLFRLTWPCLNIKILATQIKFFEPSGYWTVINYTFIFLHNKCLWLLPWCYGSVWICKAQVTKLDYIACSSAQLLNHTLNEAMHMSAHLDTIYHYLNCFGHMINTPQTNTYQNTVKRLIHPRIGIQIYTKKIAFLLTENLPYDQDFSLHKLTMN